MPTKIELHQALNRANEELVALRHEVSALRVEKIQHPMSTLMARAKQISTARKVLTRISNNHVEVFEGNGKWSVA